MEDAVYTWEQAQCKFSALSAQLCCETNTALKIQYAENKTIKQINNFLPVGMIRGLGIISVTGFKEFQSKYF